MPKNYPELTAERLREVLSYDPLTGVFTWKVRTGPRVKVGSIAHYKHHRGYVHICVDTRSYMAHRLAWLHAHGCWPAKEIDHINGVCGDNRLSNLREATHAENLQNTKKSKRNRSGYRGVSRFREKWQAEITVGGMKKYLGIFATPEEASRVYLQAKQELHSFSPTPR